MSENSSTGTEKDERLNEVLTAILEDEEVGRKPDRDVLFWENIQSLIDHQAAPDVLPLLRAEAQTVPGVRAVEKLRARRMGIEYVVDIHIQVDGSQTVRSGHAIAHAVKDRLVSRVAPVSDVPVHFEPVSG